MLTDATDSSIANDGQNSASFETATDAISKLRIAPSEQSEASEMPVPVPGRTILCPVNDDDISAAAVKWAVKNIYRDRRDTIHLLKILPPAHWSFTYAYAPPPTRERLDKTEIKQFVRDEAKRAIQVRFGRDLAIRKVPYVIDLTTGQSSNVAIGELICAISEAVQASVICMATHNRGAMRRFFVGSVANYCLRNSKVPVVMIRPEEGTVLNRSHHRVLIQKSGGWTIAP